MDDKRDRPCANCRSKEPTAFAILYRDRAKARICVACRRLVDGLPTRATNSVSETLPTFAVVLAVSGEEWKLDPLFTVGWDILDLMYPHVASVFRAVAGE